MTLPIHTVKHVRADFRKYQIIAILFAAITLATALIAAISGIQLAKLRKQEVKARNSPAINSPSDAMIEEIKALQSELEKEKAKTTAFTAKVDELQKQITAALKKNKRVSPPKAAVPAPIPAITPAKPVTPQVPAPQRQGAEPTRPESQKEQQPPSPATETPDSKPEVSSESAPPPAPTQTPANAPMPSPDQQPVLPATPEVKEPMPIEKTEMPTNTRENAPPATDETGNAGAAPEQPSSSQQTVGSETSSPPSDQPLSEKALPSVQGR